MIKILNIVFILFVITSIVMLIAILNENTTAAKIAAIIICIELTTGTIASIIEIWKD